ncbi:MAG: hypothetical protein VB858_14630 [Planctomycetaceae bacterium]
MADVRRNLFQKAAVTCWLFGGVLLVERLATADFSGSASTAGKETPVIVVLSLISLVAGSVFQKIGS